MTLSTRTNERQNVIGTGVFGFAARIMANRTKKYAKKLHGEWRRMICRLTISVKVDIMPSSCALDSIHFHGYRAPAYGIRASWHTHTLARARVWDKKIVRCFPSIFFFLFVFASLHWHWQRRARSIFCFQSFRSWIWHVVSSSFSCVTKRERVKKNRLLNQVDTQTVHNKYSTIFAMCQCRRSYAALNQHHRQRQRGGEGTMLAVCVCVSFAFKSHSPKIYVIWIDTSSKFAFCCRRHRDVVVVVLFGGGVFDKTVFYSTRARATTKKQKKIGKRNLVEWKTNCDAKQRKWRARAKEEAKNSKYFSTESSFFICRLLVSLPLFAALDFSFSCDFVCSKVTSSHRQRSGIK